MYKQLKKQLSEKRLLEDQIRRYEDRIKFKIQKQLGLHATTYTELKIECPIIEDKFAKVFGQIEELDKERQELVGELSIINESLKDANKLMKQLNEKEMEVFRCRYFMGLSRKQTAERLHYSEDRVKQITREILQK